LDTFGFGGNDGDNDDIQEVTASDGNSKASHLPLVSYVPFRQLHTARPTLGHSTCLSYFPYRHLVNQGDMHSVSAITSVPSQLSKNTIDSNLRLLDSKRVFRNTQYFHILFKSLKRLK